MIFIGLGLLKTRVSITKVRSGPLHFANARTASLVLSIKQSWIGMYYYSLEYSDFLALS